MLGGRLVTRVRRFFGKDQDASEAAFKVSVAQASDEVKALLDADFAQAAARAGQAVSEKELRVGWRSLTCTPSNVIAAASDSAKITPQAWWMTGGGGLGA